MYEYVNDKVKHGKIDNQWIFFSKGKEYSEQEYNYAINHSALESDFILKGVKKEEPKVEVKKEIVKEPKVIKQSVKKKASKR